ncbi:hypothetical protein [Nocardia sp. NPDC051750]|uniref:hypothetical protein n=1 Tax=Nocardia sp. NPDC051750 TaxID=3364325 RepID=UPI0037A6BBE2
MDAEKRSTANSPSASGAVPDPHTQVTAGDLRRLLETQNAQATLLLTAGRVEIHSDPGADAPGLTVLTRAELAERVGTAPDENTLTTQAAELNTEIRLLGA